MPTSLPLGATLDGTLAHLGTRTRRNLRYYRRRAVTELGAHFAPNPQLGREEFLAFNRASTHPRSQEEAIWRHSLFERSKAWPTTLYAGLRSARGEWLSLIWGRRYEGVAEIEWQVNRAGAAQHSISIAMRTFLMEHEIALGTVELRFIGGTQHSISTFCSETPVTDILATRRRSLRSWALHHFAQRLLPEANFLRGALQDERMTWSKGRALSWAWAGLRIL